MSYVTLTDDAATQQQYAHYWVKRVEQKYRKTLARLARQVEKDADRILAKMGQERDFDINIIPEIVVVKRVPNSKGS